MGMLNKNWTEAEIDQISYDLAIARARVYKKWGFDDSEIATLVDLPESQIRDAIYEEENNE